MTLFPAPVLALLNRAGDRPCFEHGDRTLTGLDTLRLVRRAVAGLRAAGLRRGAGIAVLPGYTPEGFALLHGAFVLGLRVANLRPGMAAGQFRHVLSQQVDALVYDRAELPDALKAVARATPLLPLETLFERPGDGEELTVEARPADIARITYTSGSTGQPKGVANTYAALSTDWTLFPQTWTPALRDLAAGLDRFLLHGTLASNVVMNYTLATLQHGGVAVVPADVPDPLYPEVVERYRISGAFITVPNYYRLLDGIKHGSPDVSSLRALMVAGSPLSPKRLAEGLERLGPVVFNGYGQTEAGGLSMLSPREVAAHGPAALTSAGKPYEQVSLSIRDENGDEASHGEVFVRAPWQTVGYWCMPEESKEVYVDGWIRTRDLGHVDEHGYLHLAGRTRDVIIVNALNYYAGPIEAALTRHESVAEAYVTGAPDERTGEAIHAFVVPARSTVDTEALKEVVKTHLGEASVPADITVITSVPMAPSGKPDKKALLAHL